MNFALSDEQHMLEEAADQALTRNDTLAAARATLDDSDCSLLVWDTAVTAGWPGLLVDEEYGGAGLGALEAMLVAQACGRRLANAGLIGHLPASAALNAAGHDRSAALASGEVRAALVDGSSLGAETEDLRIDGVSAAVIDGVAADVLVVIRDAEDAPGAWVVDVDDSVAVTTAASYDGARTLGDVHFRQTPAQRLDLSPSAIAEVAALQRALLGAEALGAAEACLRMSVEYANQRQAFGRVIGSFQAVKHKIVEMLRLSEVARSLSYYAGWTWTSNREEFVLAAHAIRVAGQAAADYASAENIFIHGGTGATWEHDASLYYRRAEMSRRLLNGVDAAAVRIGSELVARAGSVPGAAEQTA